MFNEVDSTPIHRRRCTRYAKTLSLVVGVITAIALGSMAEVAAQRTWIVGLNGGAGVDFTEIQPAIDAASPGDVIIVKPGLGFHRGFTLDKGLSIMPELRGWGIAVTSDIVVRGIPVDQRAELKRMTGRDTSSLILENNLGSVSIEKCQTGGHAGLLVIRGCRSVLLNEVYGDTTRIESSFVTMNRCLNSSGLASDPVLDVRDSVVVFGNSALFGTRGNYDFQRCAVIYPPGDAIAGSNSVLVLGAGTELRAGRMSGAIPPCPPVFVEGYSVRGRNLHVLKDPAATMTPVGPGVTVTTAAFPTLDGIVGDEVNGRMDFDTIGAGGSATVLLASPPASPLLTPMGFQWIDFGAYLVADVAILDPTGHRRVSFPFPALYPLGRAMHFQSVVLDPSGLRWSTPSAIVRN